MQAPRKTTERMGTPFEGYIHGNVWHGGVAGGTGGEWRGSRLRRGPWPSGARPAVRAAG